MTTYTIPESNMPALQRRIDAYARRSAKLGLDPLTVEVVGERTVSFKNAWGQECFRLFKLVEASGNAPVVAGYTFVARVEHTEAGNIISVAPGARDIAIPANVRGDASTCDHCSLRRHRIDTFLLREDSTGNLIRCGRNCLADFVRSPDAAAAIGLFQFLSHLADASVDLDGDGELEDGQRAAAGGASYDSLTCYLAHVSRAIRLHGWTSRSSARYDVNAQVATADDALACMGRRPAGDDAGAAWDEAQPLAEDTADVEATLTWVASLSGDSDYEHNLKTACALDYVKPRNMGIVASAVAGYLRHRDEATRRAVEVKLTSDHFGVAGCRYRRQLTVTQLASWEGEFGTTVLYSLQDDAGNVFKWFSTGDCDLEVGATRWFVFTVKSHDAWEGMLQTVITRGRISKGEPGFRWVGTEGQIFKTKKAMTAEAVAA